MKLSREYLKKLISEEIQSLNEGSIYQYITFNATTPAAIITKACELASKGKHPYGVIANALTEALGELGFLK